MQRVVAIPNGRFGATCRVPSSSVKNPKKDGADKLSRNVGKKLPLIAA